MKSKLLAIATVFAAAVFAFGFVGCDDDDDNQGPPRFSAEVGFYYGDDFVWVILHSTTGADSVIRLDEEGVADFGELSESRITWTLIRSSDYSGYQSYTIESFVDVPAGHWDLTFPSFNDDDIGEAGVTMTFPEGYYGDYLLNSPNLSFHDYFYGNGPWSQYSSFLPIYELEADNKISIIASIYEASGELPSHIGYILDCDYAVTGENEYAIELNKELIPHEIQCNRELTNLRILGIKGQTEATFQIGFTPAEFNSTIYMLDEFPADRYYSDVSYDENPYYSYQSRTDNLPSTLPIPQTDISFTYSEESRSYQNVELSGGHADYFEALWSHIGDMGTTGAIYHWSIQSDIEAELRFPQLPAEILVEMHDFNPSDMEPRRISLHESDAINGFSDYLRMRYLNPDFDRLYNGSYEFYLSRYYSASSAEQNREEFSKWVKESQELNPLKRAFRKTKSTANE